MTSADTKTVFVSSTVFDLLDVRAELSAAIREMGLIPYVSGCDDSEISALPTANSIETCLEHVRRADFVIVVLDQRYGPRLGKVGFEDISATQLEYREARRSGKPIWLYARDRLEAEYRLWTKNREQGLTLRWAEHSLLEFLHEHQKLDATKPGSNWFDTFADSVHLKRLISRDLALPSSNSRIRRLLETNSLPSVSPEVHAVHFERTDVHCTVNWLNSGNTPAIEFTVEDARHNKKTSSASIGCGHKHLVTLTFDTSKSNSNKFAINTRFFSVFGIEVP